MRAKLSKSRKGGTQNLNLKKSLWFFLSFLIFVIKSKNAEVCRRKKNNIDRKMKIIKGKKRK